MIEKEGIPQGRGTFEYERETRFCEPWRFHVESGEHRVGGDGWLATGYRGVRARGSDPVGDGEARVGEGLRGGSGLRRGRSGRGLSRQLLRALRQQGRVSVRGIRARARRPV